MKRSGPLDELYMMECLALAAHGAGAVSPNPLVGALLVKNGRVIGRGFHKRFGGEHAEVAAIRSASSSPRGATLFVNLEPCNHHGKTGPCTAQIVRAGIRRVVVGMRDPNPLVNGRGLRVLRRARIRVDVGVLETECMKLNEAFAAFITRKTPFVAMKIAQTLDGRLDTPAGGGRWITNVSSRAIVHGLRARYDAVLIGAGTVRADDPALTVRHVKGRNPVRVILDGRLRTSISSNVYKDARTIRTLLIVSSGMLARKKSLLEMFGSRHVEVVHLASDGRGRISAAVILRELGRRGIASLLVEGGAEVFDLFAAAGVVDKCYFFIAPKTFGDRENRSVAKRMRESIGLARIAHWNVDGDVFIEGYVA